MAYIPDLAPYSDQEPDKPLLAVGWLALGHPFAQGPVDPPVITKLADLLINPWQPAISAGRHHCEFCRFTGGPSSVYIHGHTISVGVTNLYVPGDGVLYVAPSLVLHYMDAHEYAPPREFCAAILACPPMRSMPYLRALLAVLPNQYRHV